MNFFPSEIRPALAQAPWTTVATQPNLVLKVVSHLNLGLGVVVSDLTEAWVGFYSTERLVREVSASFRGVQLSSDAEVLRLSESCLRHQGGSDSRVDVERLPDRPNLLRLRLKTSLDLLDDHRIHLSFALDCSAINSVVADDAHGVATSIFLREVLWTPLVGLTHALSGAITSLVASGRVTPAELDALSKCPSILAASRNAMPVISDEMIERIRANLVGTQTTGDAAPQNVRGSSPKMTEPATIAEAPRKRDLPPDSSRPVAPKSAEEERLKKIRRVLKYFLGITTVFPLQCIITHRLPKFLLSSCNL